MQLTRNNGMQFYDAELWRVRAHTHREPQACRADLRAALKLARPQGATLFALRAALDDVELRGRPACSALIEAASSFPADTTLPELARAHAVLR